MGQTVISNGVRLAYDSVGAGPMLLFLSGAGDAQGTWAEVVEALADRYRCVTMDMRGQGDSARCPGGYQVRRFAGDVVAVLEVVGEPAVLVGHSLGAMTAFQVAASGHRLVRAAFLEDPPLFLGDREAFESTVFPKMFRWMRREFGSMQTAGADPAVFSTAFAALPSLDGRRIGEVQTERAIAEAGKSMARWDLEMLDAALDGSVWDGLDPDAAVGCPLAVLQSDPGLGAAFRPADTTRLLAANPGATISLFEGADHNIHASRAFQRRFIEELEQFLSRL